MHIASHALRVDYDEESDTLFLYSGKEKSQSSVSLGDMILDYANDGTIVSLEFLDASRSLSPLVLIMPAKDKVFDESGNFQREALKNIKKANVSMSTLANYVVIAFTLEFNESFLRAPINARITVPNVSKEELINARLLASVG